MEEFSIVFLFLSELNMGMDGRGLHWYSLALGWAGSETSRGCG